MGAGALGNLNLSPVPGRLSAGSGVLVVPSPGSPDALPVTAAGPAVRLPHSQPPSLPHTVGHRAAALVSGRVGGRNSGADPSNAAHSGDPSGHSDAEEVRGRAPGLLLPPLFTCLLVHLLPLPCWELLAVLALAHVLLC